MNFLILKKNDEKSYLKSVLGMSMKLVLYDILSIYIIDYKQLIKT